MNNQEIIEIIVEIDKLREQVNKKLKKIESSLISSLRNNCPHDKVWETTPHQSNRQQKGMFVPIRICTSCLLRESWFSGYNKLEKSEVVKKISDEDLKEITFLA